MSNAALPTFSTTFTNAFRTLNNKRSELLVGTLLIAAITVASYVIASLVGYYPGGISGYGLSYGSIILSGILSFVVTQFGQLFFYILAIRKEANFNQMLTETGKRFVSFIGLMVIVYLKTFVWLTALGIMLISMGMFMSMGMVYLGGAFVLAGIALNIVLLPKYILSPVFWIVEKTSIIGATKRSAEAATGKVLHIVLTLILLFLVMFVGRWVVSMALSPFTFTASFNSPSMGIAWVYMVIEMFFTELFTAFTIAFFVHLAASIASAKPMKKG